MPVSNNTSNSVYRRPRRGAGIGIILALALGPSVAAADEPPPDLAQRAARRATETRCARENYTYRQTFTEETLTASGARSGEYREVRDVIFLPGGERTEVIIGKPLNTLKNLKLTDEDFQDMREVQPFLFDSEQLWLYETRPKGEETIDGVDCWLLEVRPRQILAGQRLFQGLLWVSKKDFSIVRTEGKAVPDMRSMRMEKENLFPHFTTLWAPVDGNYRFPVYTYADDTLDFRLGPQRIRLTIRYTNYRRFTTESTIRYEEKK